MKNLEKGKYLVKNNQIGKLSLKWTIGLTIKFCESTLKIDSQVVASSLIRATKIGSIVLWPFFDFFVL